MSWKCVCKEQDNPDDSKVCKNCGRPKPKYLGVRLNLEASEKMTNQQKSVWYLMIAYNYLLESIEYLELEREFSKKLGNLEYNQKAVESKITEFLTKTEYNCQQSLALLKKCSVLDPEIQFKDEKGYIQNVSSIKSDCYFNLGTIYFRRNDFEKAIKYYQASFKADPNQVSIYNIAMATINLPVEGGGLFGGKKRERALETKREQEIDLLKKTIKFAPFSRLGIKSARLLIDQYEISDIDI